MAKKSKDEAPNPNNVPNRDIIQRLHFLYQASVYLDGVSPPQKKKQKRVTISDLSRSYVSSMKIVGQKTTVNMDPSVKRTICKGCDTVLVPGSTVSIRVKKSRSRGHLMVYTCTRCKTSRRIPAPPVDASTTADSRPAGKGPKPRIPPLFARKAGHVTFCGQEQVPTDETSLGDGVFIV
ncbi:RNAse P Rpr2/Rpp21/SNM1 subunit domain-containing protein [Desarmillaria tabescens]|uniref:RNAse P Rpr2/Rpp21/SNM1 subunit domain-containing protein n=1 Tax=Armillaria tabescens TaxID=1929756 RepID=A0AA39NFM5_ARMTA|nr:RNAse P Rpr2/Rpp21/SNM1 subunit domain-containing protein [Desarmillaria tabescens]KAK0464735.1 RNAse P Rpr2/Rpp21/SNM1 subunit domain-containing protein [Desarmillaria tabescens]